MPEYKVLLMVQGYITVDAADEGDARAKADEILPCEIESMLSIDDFEVEDVLEG